MNFCQPIDISPTISPELGVFPGDTPFSKKELLSISKGDSIGLSSVTTTLHLGAHADAPVHYTKEGVGIAECSLLPYIGPCQVVHAKVARGQRVCLKDLGKNFAIQAPRILIYTGTFPSPQKWNGDFAALDPALLNTLHKSGVCLIGIDTPSIDLQDSKELPSHQEVAKGNMAILEGLVLAHVPAGLYTLVALPLKIEGADASPVRAVLFP